LPHHAGLLTAAVGAGQGPSAVVWARAGNSRRAERLRRIEAHFAAILHARERGETLIEIVESHALSSRAKTNYPSGFAARLFSNP